MKPEAMAVALVGLGYVGLPLAVEFGKRTRRSASISPRRTSPRIADITIQPASLSSEQLKEGSRLFATTDPSTLKEADFVVVAVRRRSTRRTRPTCRRSSGRARRSAPISSAGRQSFSSRLCIRGPTEEVCIPILERHSGMQWQKDVFVGYSPERINPGDRKHTLTTIVKVVSEDSPRTLDLVAEVYGSIVAAGVYNAKSIKVAEAAKVIDNTQRDLNIALVNELSLIFHRIGIDTLDVLHTAGRSLPAVPARARRRAPASASTRTTSLTRPKCLAITRRSPWRPPHQRRDGQVHRAADGQIHGQRRADDPGCACDHPRPHVGGKLS